MGVTKVEDVEPTRGQVSEVAAEQVAPDAAPACLPDADRRAVDRVSAQLAGNAPLGVAFSGGVDSTVLLALAARCLGAANVIAVLAVSPSLAADERTAAHELAAFVGVRVVEIETHEGQRAEYRRNGPDRCYFCKDELFTRLSDDVVAAYGLVAVAYGENADDALRPDRPGARAATEHQVLRPLAEAGIGKAAVRRIAHALQLPNADKPAAPCLASRIPHFQPVEPAKLRQIEDAEAALRALGFADCRVRHHGEVARVELCAGDIASAAAEPLRSQLRAAVLAAGFRFVALDLAGIQSGAFTLPLVSG